jgi:glycosyltransferase involved in cell wall biosynthesis
MSGSTRVESDEKSLPEVSLIIPVYDEEENIGVLVSEIDDALAEIRYEAIFIDDGSRDGTLSELTTARHEHPELRIIKLKRNWGKSAALMMGFEAARAPVCITLDGDLQDDPAEIPAFLEAISRGSDLVCGWRDKRRDGISKRLPSNIYNVLARWTLRTRLKDMNCGFKAFDSNLAKSLNLYGDMHRYIPVLCKMKGAVISEIPVNHRPRRHGRSKYGSKRLLRGILDMFTVGFLLSFLERPLHLFGRIGLLFSLAGVGTGGYLVFLKYSTGAAIGDRPLLLLSVLLVTMGVQLFMLGLLGEAFGYRSHERPSFELLGEEL